MKNCWRDIENLKKKRRRMFICFEGIDGSGKTTHALNLYNELLNRGLFCVYLRPRYILARSFPSKPQESHTINAIYSSLKQIAFQSNSSGCYRYKSLARFLALLKVPVILSFLAYAHFTYVLILRPISKKSILICDRYFFDWIFHLFGESSVNLVRLLPKPDLVVLLDISVPLAFERMSYTEDRRKSTCYYQSLRNWYQTIARQVGFVTIDASDDFEKTKNQVIDLVMSLLSDEID